MDFGQVPNLDEVDKLLARETEVVSFADAVKMIRAQKGGKDHFPIGFEMFSSVMKGGVGDGDLVVISGRSGHGKTTFAQTISYHLAELGLPQLWFSYEMELEEVWDKFLEMGVKEDFIGYVPLKLASGSVDWLEQRIDEAILKYNTKVVFIDHLGFLNPKVDERNARQFESNFSNYLGQLVRQLKLLALEKRIVIFLLAHTRKTKEALGMEDIAHSVGIAQEADFVFMVERLALKPERKKWDDSPIEGEILSDQSKISLVKNRRTGRQKFMKAEIKGGRLVEARPNNVLNQPQPDDTFIE